MLSIANRCQVPKGKIDKRWIRGVIDAVAAMKMTIKPDVLMMNEVAEGREVS